MSKTKISFLAAVQAALGTTRDCNDGSGVGPFAVTPNNADGIATNLTDWWDDKYSDVEYTAEYAKEYFDKTYPEKTGEA